MSNDITDRTHSRRDVCRFAAGAIAASALGPARLLADEKPPPFRFRYVLASSLYGKMKLAEILPEVGKTGAEHIDIWPERHANQREQIEEMGHDKFAELLKKHRVKLGVMSRYDLGPFGLQDEMRVVKKLGGSTLICGAAGPRTLKGAELKAAVQEFAEKMKPHVAVAEKLGVTIAIENHGHNLIESPDSMRWFVEFARSKSIGIALAPYHLPQDPKLIGQLIEQLGPRLLHLYAWQHGKGCHLKLPKEEAMLQMPGRGSMDFAPIIAALKKTDYRGWLEIFMHPVPRGVPIAETTEEVTAEINRARKYLGNCLQKPSTRPA